MGDALDVSPRVKAPHVLPYFTSTRIYRIMCHGVLAALCPPCWVGPSSCQYQLDKTTPHIGGLDMRFIPCITDLSRLTCYYITGDNESWCSKAWRLSSEWWFWRMWVYTFGIQHCHKSNEFHRRNKK